MEVRRSLPKLIAFGLFAAPFAFVLGTVLVMLAMIAYLQRPDLLYVLLTIGGVPFILSAAICCWYVALCRRVGAHDPYFILTPDGLVMPSLGSSMPVPWDDVNTMWSPGLGIGLWRSFYVELNADPETYPHLLGPFMGWRKPKCAGEKIKQQKSFHATFDLGVEKLREAMGEFKERYGMKDDKNAATKPPASFWVIAAISSVLMTAIFSAIFYSQFHPIDWIGYAILGGIWVLEIPVLYVFYDLYNKSAGKKARGLQWSGFGEQRVDIGTVKKRD